VGEAEGSCEEKRSEGSVAGGVAVVHLGPCVRLFLDQSGYKVP
jgi:hypothetical protein